MEVKLTLSDEATSKKVEVTGNLNDDEEKVLKSFSEEAFQLLLRCA